MGTKVKTEKIESHEVEFSVNEDGHWYASAGVLEGASHGKTLQEARAKITARLRRETAKVNIKAHVVNVLPGDELNKPWYQRDDAAKANMLRPITLTGFSQRSGDVMFTFDDSGAKGKKSPHQTHKDPDSIGIVVRRLTDAEQKEYKRMRAAFDISRDELGAWINERKIPDVTKFMEGKIAEAIDETPAEEPETADPREAPLRDSRKPVTGWRKPGKRG